MFSKMSNSVLYYSHTLIYHSDSIPMFGSWDTGLVKVLIKYIPT